MSLTVLLAIASAIGTLSPLIIAIIQQPWWSDKARALVTMVWAVVLGVATAVASGALSGFDLHTLAGTVGAISVVLVAAQGSYGTWKKLGVTAWIENATSRAEPVVAPETGELADSEGIPADSVQGTVEPDPERAETSTTTN